MTDDQPANNNNTNVEDDVTATRSSKTSESNDEFYAYEPSRLLKSYHNLRTRIKAAQEKTSHPQNKAEKEDHAPAAATTTSSKSSLFPNLMKSPTKTAAAVGTSFHHHENSQNKKLVVAAIQLTASFSSNHDIEGFWARAKASVVAAAHSGATVILLPELFLGPYFCQSQEASLYGLADPAHQNFVVREFQIIAKQLGVVLPISFYERHNNAYYNSISMIDADGSLLGIYRKSHIPDGTGYQEKFYFSPGDTGFQVWDTMFGKVGVAICWDQWFPEAARSMALMGADVLLYPTAIGTEPQDPTIDSSSHWQRVMQGHAAANMIPIVASNRYGTEVLLQSTTTQESGTHEHYEEKQRIRFYGKSFVTDETGAIVKEAQDGADILVVPVDAKKNQDTRAAW
eukprot:CAMPEP_0195247994 /NCGR_PEP_ID=MMETSP0706-20130129/1285_1 /TAXON_ID=33640 /ORGANISM="Asterionellopsis glacialis, Strain CCMP134" /LENGTH=398 /DNA_ID=CAMNT_0040299579 /DNA_START=240 /DNA_END=1433 /DNA_ORIENTATION=-